MALERATDHSNQWTLRGVRPAAHVVAFTTSESKRQAAMALGANKVVVSRNAHEMATAVKSCDFILNTVAAPHDLDPFFGVLKRDGTMALVGAPATPHPDAYAHMLRGDVKYRFVIDNTSLATA